MCGIFGYVGVKNALKLAIEGLKRLEYRGYDSAGIAAIVKDHNKNLFVCKELGKISSLEKELEKAPKESHIAVAQTRWATHGKPSKINAHPHLDEKETLALVHNGIIENHVSLRKKLSELGVSFLSETDTEVVAQLLGYYYEGNLLEAIFRTTQEIKGAFAIAFIHQDYPDMIVAMAKESPLAIGIGENEVYVASDVTAFAEHTREVIFLGHGEVAFLKKEGVEIYNAEGSLIQKERETLDYHAEDISKGSYEHYTLKEIHEQPETIRNAFSGRFQEEYGTAFFEEIKFDVSELLSVKRILILGCGSSWHAGHLAAYMLEDRARIPVQVEISSEYRYKNPIVPAGTFVIAISQSGETADTVAAVRELKAKGAKILSICNVQNSTLARESDSCIFLRAGPEIGVCSTKAFTSQVIVLALFTLLMARMRHMGKEEGQQFIKALKKLPEQVKEVLNRSSYIQALAKKYAVYNNFFFLGRSYMFPACLEGALKLKEISYINANGYAAGEMKHGPIALIGPDCPTVAFAANKSTFDKLLSNLMEIKARQGLVLAIAEESEKGLEDIASDLIIVPGTIDELANVLTIVASQLLAYFIAKERGTDIDQPRNLAKSVTVE